MQKDMTLLIMAAGMGSRFGGLKQIEGMGPNGEFLIDYSIYDAIKAGFNKVVFIIKEENYDVFKETIGKRVEEKIEVSYVFQKIEDVPVPVNVARIKPWGTGHAILAARNEIKGLFAVINSDDFYGRDAYFKMAEYLTKLDNSNKIELEYALLGYEVKNTMTENGSVKRGVCNANINNQLISIVESLIEKNGNSIIASPLNGKLSFIIKENEIVSVNFFGFDDSIFELLNKKFAKFLEENESDLTTCEFLIPEILEELIKENIINMKLLETTALWLGVTYKEDKERVVKAIQQLIDDGEYPNNLWD